MKTKEWSGNGKSSHIVAKIVCLLLAVVLWLYVMYDAAPQYTEVYANVPVAVLGTEDLTSTSTPVVRVRVRGTKAALYECDEEDIHASVHIADLADKDGKIEVGITHTATVVFELPEGMSVDGDYTVSVFVQEKTV